MLPEVERYLAAYEIESEQFNKAIDALNYRDDLHHAADSFGHRLRKYPEFDCEMQKLIIAHFRQFEKLWQELGIQTNDPFIKWLTNDEISTQYDTPDYAHLVLERWPMSLRELDDLAANERWCSVYDGIIIRAIQDGVFPLTAGEIARHELEGYLRNEVDFYYISNIMRLVDELIAAHQTTDAV